MNYMEFSKMVSEETLSFEFIRKKYGKQLNCKHCGSKKFYYPKSKNRVRCAKCKKDLRLFVSTRFGTVRITYSKWLAIIKLFELSVSANEAARQMDLDYKTVLKAFDAIRLAIVTELAKTDKALRGEIEADEAYFGGKRKGNRGRSTKRKKVVFGMLERKGRVSLEIVPDAKAATLTKAVLKMAKTGSMVYTDQWGGYNSLIFHGYKHKTVNHSKMFSRGKISTNGLEGFWSFSKERMAKYHGVSRKKFILYIKEMEWRYNNRDQDLFELLTGYMLVASYP